MLHMYMYNSEVLNVVLDRTHVRVDLSNLRPLVSGSSNEEKLENKRKLRGKSTHYPASKGEIMQFQGGNEKYNGGWEEKEWMEGTTEERKKPEGKDKGEKNRRNA